MNLGSAQAAGLARDIKRRMATLYAGPETAVCPSHPHLSIVGEILEQVQIPGLGLEVGKRTNMVDHGILGYAFISSETITSQNSIIHA